MPVYITNGTIIETSNERNTFFITVNYIECQQCQQVEQTVRLNVTPCTVILNRNNMPIPASRLRTGMTINAAFSPTMTRSLPPQANAFEIQVV